MSIGGGRAAIVIGAVAVVAGCESVHERNCREHEDLKERYTACSVACTLGDQRSCEAKAATSAAACADEYDSVACRAACEEHGDPPSCARLQRELQREAELNAANRAKRAAAEAARAASPGDGGVAAPPGDGAPSKSTGSSPPYGPVILAEHLPPAVSTLKLGVSTLEQAKALFPPEKHRTIEVSRDKTYGGDEELRVKMGPNKGLPYSLLRIGREKQGTTFLGQLGEHYRFVKFRFSKLAGRGEPVLYNLGVVQHIDGGATVCRPASKLVGQPGALEECPEGVEPRRNSTAERYGICGGTADGAHQVMIVCSGSMVIYDMVVPRTP